VATTIAPDELLKLEIIADPYPAYRQLRDSSPFKYVDVPAGSFPGIEGPLRSWALMKYSDVYGALRDHETLLGKTVGRANLCSAADGVRRPAASQPLPPPCEQGVHAEAG
jgi:hypothetical protein